MKCPLCGSALKPDPQSLGSLTVLKGERVIHQGILAFRCDEDHAVYLDDDEYEETLTV